MLRHVTGIVTPFTTSLVPTYGEPHRECASQTRVRASHLSTLPARGAPGEAADPGRVRPGRPLSQQAQRQCPEMNTWPQCTGPRGSLGSCGAACFSGRALPRLEPVDHEQAFSRGPHQTEDGPVLREPDVEPDRHPTRSG